MSMSQEPAASTEWTDPFSYNAATSLQRDIIIELAQHYPDGISGVEIQNGLKEIYGERVKKGTFYMSVDRLVDRGLIKKDKESFSGRSYKLSLTDECVDYLDEYLDWCAKRGVPQFREEVGE